MSASDGTHARPGYAVAPNHLLIMVAGAVVNFYVSYLAAQILQFLVGFRRQKHLNLAQNQALFLILFACVIVSRYVISTVLFQLPITLHRPEWQSPQLKSNFFSGWAYAIVLGQEMKSFFRD